MNLIVGILFFLGLTACMHQTSSVKNESETSKLSGKVSLKIVQDGLSESGSEKVILTDAQGKEIFIRDPEEPPFDLPESKSFVGSTVICVGNFQSDEFLYNLCQVIAPLPDGMESVTGKITLEKIDDGMSESGSDVVILNDGNGKKIQIRTHDESPFELEESKHLAGKSVTCVGRRLDNEVFEYETCI
ncbi:MAG: hypothetical protein AB7T49_04180 [Oligoflexales bacterium]